MEFKEFSWERHSPSSGGASFSSADLEAMARLMAELREITQSRRTYAETTAFLERFGFEVEGASLVMPDVLAN